METFGTFIKRNASPSAMGDVIVQLNERIALSNIQKNFYIKQSNDSQRKILWRLNNVHKVMARRENSESWGTDKEFHYTGKKYSSLDFSLFTLRQLRLFP